MNKALSFVAKSCTSLCELILALSVALAIFIFVAVGFILIGDFTCIALGYSEGICRIS